MKRIITLALVICAVGMAARPAVGGFIKSNDLHEWCGGVSDSLCSGYILGAFDMWHIEMQRLAEGRGLVYRSCLPKVQAQQVVDVVKNYLVEHSEKRHSEATVIVVAATREAWPCPK